MGFEVLGIMFDETLSAITFRDAETLDADGMNLLEEPSFRRPIVP